MLAIIRICRSGAITNATVDCNAKPVKPSLLVWKRAGKGKLSYRTCRLILMTLENQPYSITTCMPLPPPAGYVVIGFQTQLVFAYVDAGDYRLTARVAFDCKRRRHRIGFDQFPRTGPFSQCLEESVNIFCLVKNRRISMQIGPGKMK